jgi:hypothetical protein
VEVVLGLERGLRGSVEVDFDDLLSLDEVSFWGTTVLFVCTGLVRGCEGLAETAGFSDLGIGPPEITFFVFNPALSPSPATFTTFSTIPELFPESGFSPKSSCCFITSGIPCLTAAPAPSTSRSKCR